MKNNSKYIILVLLLIINVSVFGKPVLDIQSWTTESGVDVLFTERHELPMIDIRIIFYAGSVFDGEKFGISSFTNSMFGKGTKSLSADEIAERFDQVGANFSVSAGVDVVRLNLRCLVEQEILNDALQTFISVLTEPVFTGNMFDLVQKQTLNSILINKQTPMLIANNEFYKELYAGSPYAYPSIGTLESVSAIKSDDLLEFYHKYYTAKNAIIVIVGDVTKEKAKDIADRVTSNLLQGDCAMTSPRFVKKPKAITKHIDVPSKQVAAKIGQVGVTIDSRDYFPLLIGNYILGGSLNSELFQEVREKRGLTYIIGSLFGVCRETGTFSIFFSADKEKIRAALDVSMKVLKRFVENGPTAEQLELAKASLVTRFPLSFAANASVLSILEKIGVYHLPLNYYDNFCDKIRSVTSEQMQDAFKRHIDLDHPITITVGDF